MELHTTNGQANRIPVVTARKTPVKKPVAKPPQYQHDGLAVVVAIPVALSTVALSMVLNCWAFTHATPGALGYVVGVALPLWVLALTFLGQHMNKRDSLVCYGAYALAIFLLAVSLPHLAHGYATLGISEYEGWALALVTDLCQVLCKMAFIQMVAKKA